MPGIEEAERDSEDRVFVPGGFPPTWRCLAHRCQQHAVMYKQARHSGHGGSRRTSPRRDIP